MLSVFLVTEERSDLRIRQRQALIEFLLTLQSRNLKFGRAQVGPLAQRYGHQRLEVGCRQLQMIVVHRFRFGPARAAEQSTEAGALCAIAFARFDRCMACLAVAHLGEVVVDLPDLACAEAGAGRLIQPLVEVFYFFYQFDLATGAERVEKIQSDRAHQQALPIARHRRALVPAKVSGFQT